MTVSKRAAMFIGRAAHRILAEPPTPVAEAGSAVASGAALLWGRMLGGSVRTAGELTVVTGLPDWAFGRGGTCVGSTYLTGSNDGDRVLRHEAVHAKQWRRYGLAMVPLYVLAGREAARNRFEIEAGLEDGGYRG